MSQPSIRRLSSANCWFGRPYGPPIAFVVHTQSGGESGTISEFLSGAAQFSTHYAAGLDGVLDCYIDPGDRAWANGVLEPGNRWTTIASNCGVDPALNPNHITVSCETEDLGRLDRQVSDDQYRAVLYAVREVRRRYPTSLRYLASHADISPQSRPDCPGPRWLASGRFQALASTVGLQTLAI